jgi:homoserine O-acetyltransferase/O-succinyltransferase
MQDRTFRIEHFTTQSGATLDLQLAYRVHGQLNAATDNLIIYPTYYSGRSDENEYLIGDGMGLDPKRFCIVVPNLFGNGVSTSPSNAPEPWSKSRFPMLTYFDNVMCQRRLIQSEFGVERVHAVVGYSMGAMQAYQWAAQYPNAVARFVAICGTAKVAEHNQLFLDSLRAAIVADQIFNAGDYDQPPLMGLEAFATIYASWLTSQRFFAERLYRQLGFGIDDLAGFVALVKAFFMRNDANDLLAMASTWRAGDPSANDIYGGDFGRAMRSISARGLIMPCDTDLYFRAGDCEEEAALLADAEFEPIRSDYGHAAGGGLDATSTRLLNARISGFLEI